VEELDGTVVRPSRYLPPEQPAPQVASRRASAPALDRAGFVAQRPPDNDVECGDPFFQDYRWVAFLDPVELADGNGRWFHDPTIVPITIDALRVAEHDGRECWEAVLRPNESYFPRCSCCPLLLSERSEELEVDAGGPRMADQIPGFRFADAHRIRLDLETGVCLLTEELGGSWAGDGHRMHIEAVDQPMPDSLFVPSGNTACL